jgi:hypothetical protein
MKAKCAAVLCAAAWAVELFTVIPICSIVALAGSFCCGQDNSSPESSMQNYAQGSLIAKCLDKTCPSLVDGEKDINNSLGVPFPALFQKNNNVLSIELRLPYLEEVEIRKVEVYAYTGKNANALFEVHCQKDGRWESVFEGKCESPMFCAEFAPIKTKWIRVKLSNPDAPFRIMEVEAYGPRGQRLTPIPSDAMNVLNDRNDDAQLLFEGKPKEKLSIILRNIGLQETMLKYHVLAYYITPDGWKSNGSMKFWLRDRPLLISGEKKIRFNANDGAAREEIDVGNLPPGIYPMVVQLLHKGELVCESQRLFGVKYEPRAVNHDNAEANGDGWSPTCEIFYYPIVPGIEDRLVKATLSEPIERTKDCTVSAIDIYCNRYPSFYDTLNPNPEKGLWDFTRWDKAIGYVNSRGLKAILRIMSQDSPTSLWDEDIRDQNGDLLRWKGFPAHTPSFCGEKFLEDYKNYIKDVVRHYRGHPGVAGYCFQLGREEFVYFEWWDDKQRPVFDYSKPAQEKFSSWLNREKGFSLEQLNSRYGKRYAAWNEVSLPDPRFDLVPDLRKEWIDYIDFRHYIIANVMEETFKTVREIDSETTIYQYYLGGSGATAKLTPVFKKYNVVGLDGACETPKAPIYISLANNEGISRCNENMIIPPSKTDFNQGLYYILTYGGKFNKHRYMNEWVNGESGGIWGVQQNQTPLQRDRESVRLFQKTSAFYSELLSGSEPLNSGFACLFSEGTKMHTRKSTYWKNWGIPYQMLLKLEEEKIQPTWLSEWSEALYEKLQGCKIVLDDESLILNETCLHALVRYVEKGGKLAMSADSGKYLRETGKGDYPLLRRLGFKERQERQPANELERSKMTREPDQSVLTTAELRLTDNAWLIEPDIECKVIAKYRSGKPAAVSWAHGSGEVLLVFGRVDWNASRGVLTDLAKWSACTHLIESSCDKIWASLRGGGSGVYYLNVFRAEGFHYQDNVFRKAAPASDKRETDLKLVLPDVVYGVHDMFDDHRVIGEFDCIALRHGFKLELTPGELKILKFVPRRPPRGEAGKQSK